jgi:glycosyltransferase involved in cell wall biosynthesis
LLGQCLQSLATQTLALEHYEILVVDNGSTDQTQEVAHDFARRYGSTRVILEPRLGLSHARNTGIRHARADYLAFIDDDARAFPDWVERIVRAFTETVPPPVVVGGRIVPLYEHSPPVWFDERYETSGGGNEPTFLTSRWACYDVCGGNMAIAKRMALACGCFAPELGLVGTQLRLGEDTDLVLRIFTRYARILYDPTLRVQHWVPSWKLHPWYYCRRGYRAGIATSRIEGTTLISRQTATALARRLHRWWSGGCLVPQQHASSRSLAGSHTAENQRVSLAKRAVAWAIWLSIKTGRLLGSKMF